MPTKAKPSCHGTCNAAHGSERIINSFDGEKYLAALRERVARLHDPMICVDEMHVTFTRAAGIFTYDLPPQTKQPNYDDDLPESPFAVPLIDMFAPDAAKEAISVLSICFSSEDAQKLDLFRTLRDQLWQNKRAASEAELSQRAFDSNHR